MKVKVDCTMEIDSKVMQAYIDDMGDGESIKKFAANYMITAGILCLDEGIKNAIDKDHFTGIASTYIWAQDVPKSIVANVVQRHGMV
jgi:hypothetical protein